MSLKLGIIGLPNVGKSTLFNALAKTEVPAAAYPFCTTLPNYGIAPIYDERLFALSRLGNPRSLTGSTIEFVDIAGLVMGASMGEGLGNHFLSHVRGVDALVHVVRAFQDERVPTSYPGLDPLRDVEIVETELLLSDIELLLRRREKALRLGKRGDPAFKEEEVQFNRAIEALKKGRHLRNEDLSLPRELSLLTTKPVVYVLNGEADRDLSFQSLAPLKEKCAREGAPLCYLSATVEEVLSKAGEEEQLRDQKDRGTGSALQTLIAEGLQLLQLITFYTVKGGKIKSFLIPKGTRAVDAAGKVHSDMTRGFIRAEVVSFSDYCNAGSFVLAREKGMTRVEGKEYVMQDGEVVHFRFNV